MSLNQVVFEDTIIRYISISNEVWVSAIDCLKATGLKRDHSRTATKRVKQNIKPFFEFTNVTNNLPENMQGLQKSSLFCKVSEIDNLFNGSRAQNISDVSQFVKKIEYVEVIEPETAVKTQENISKFQNQAELDNSQVENIEVVDNKDTSVYKTLVFNNIQIQSRESDKFVNATQMCKVGGKEFNHWYNNNSTKEIIQCLINKIKIQNATGKSGSEIKVVDIKRGGTKQGSWIHPQLATILAQWISIDFGLKVSEWIEEWKLIENNSNIYMNALNNIQPNQNDIQYEKIIQEYLSKQLNAQKEVETPVGYIDLLSDTELIEIKKINNWKNALGQMLAYSEFYKNKQKVIYLFGDTDKYDLNFIKTFYSNFSIKMLIFDISILKCQDVITDKDKQVKDLVDYNSIQQISEMPYNPQQQVLNPAIKEDGYIYLLTDFTMKQNNIFKLGQTINPEQRMKQYITGRVQFHRPEFILIKKTARVAHMESILLKMFESVKYEKNCKEVFQIDLNFAIKEVEKIIDYFNNTLIAKFNNYIQENIDNPNAIIYSSEIDAVTDYEKIANPEFTCKLYNKQYYEAIIESIKVYPTMELITPKEEIITQFSKCQIKCKHMQKESIEVRALLRKISCNDCIREKLQSDKRKQLYADKLQNFDNYSVKKIISTDSQDYKLLNLKVKQRIDTQNKIITFLENFNMKLISNYSNKDKIKILCEYGHETEAFPTIWRTLKNKHPCTQCRKYEELIASITIRSFSNDKDLEDIASSIGWTFVQRTQKNGIYEWLCPNNHLVLKNKIEITRKICPSCVNGAKEILEIS